MPELKLNPAKTQRNPRRAVRYVRVSTGEQKLSMGVQNKNLDSYFQYQGLEVVGTFEDEDVSGRKPLAKRPGGGQLLRLLQQDRTIGALVVPKIDRFGRNAIDIQTTYKYVVEELGVVVHVLDLGGTAFASDGPLASFMIGVLALFADLEASRIQEVLDDKFDRGEFMGGRTAPYGWDKVTTGQFKPRKGAQPGDAPMEIFALADNAEEQHWLREMQVMRDQGCSIKYIAGWLNAQVVPSKTGLQGTWTFNKVWKVLHNKHSKLLFTRWAAK